MTTPNYNDLPFSAFTEGSSISTELIKQFCIGKTARVLDLGCGIGKNLLAASRAIPNAEFIGVDISTINVTQAKKNASDNQLQNISFYIGDYLEYVEKPFDIIYADSVLHLITYSDEVLYKKISKDLLTDGILIVTMPYCCLYNYALIAFRRMLKCFRCDLIDHTILKIAKFIYPSVDLKVLEDRIPYMYIVPERLDSRSFRKLLEEKYHLTIVKSTTCHRVSLFKPKHKLLIFKKMSRQT